MIADGFLPYGRQTIEEDDIEAVSAALRGDFLTTGPKVAEFEQAFAQACGAKHAVACNSGTAALHLAVLTAGLTRDDCAIVPTMTFLATANVVRMTEAEVVFADVDSQTGLLTEQTLAAALSQASADNRRVRAVLPVHLNGQICDMAALSSLAKAQDLVVIEDACHALGADNAGATVHSDIACFSTHPVKAIATGEGGVATTASEALATHMRKLRSHGMTRDPAEFENKALAFDSGVANPWYYEMPELGWNYRMPDILCALGVSQLTKLPRFHARRREIAALYDRLLSPLAPILRPVPHSGRPHGWHLYVVSVDFDRLGTTRRQFMNALHKRGIGSQVHYTPVHLQPYYQHRYGARSLPGAEAYYAKCLSIPIFPSMSDDDVKRVAAALASIVRGNVAA